MENLKKSFLFLTKGYSGRGCGCGGGVDCGGGSEEGSKE